MHRFERTNRLGYAMPSRKHAFSLLLYNTPTNGKHFHKWRSGDASLRTEKQIWKRENKMIVCLAVYLCLETIASTEGQMYPKMAKIIYGTR